MFLLLAACSTPVPPDGAPTSAAGAPVAPPEQDAPVARPDLDAPTAQAQTGARAAPTWPAAGAVLHPPLAPPPAPSAPPIRVVIDAGHGEVGNEGNTNVRCEKEQEVTRRLQDAVVARLTTRPGVEVRAGRPDGALSYDARIRAFEAWGAAAVVSLHTDTREGAGWAIDPTTGCYAGLGAPGFSVLYSDEGAADRVAPRLALARAVSSRLAETGFLAYGGADYVGLYGPDSVSGVYVDRHAPRKRIKMLRRPKVPLVIVETHQAVDPQEVARWEEPATIDAFEAALYAAILDVAAAAQPGE